MAEIGWPNMKMNKKIIFLLAFFVYLPSVYACPMCTELIEHGKGAVQAWRFAQGIGWSILLLLAVPFGMIGTMAYIIWRASSRKTSSPLSPFSSSNQGHDGKA